METAIQHYAKLAIIRLFFPGIPNDADVTRWYAALISRQPDALTDLIEEHNPDEKSEFWTDYYHDHDAAWRATNVPLLFNVFIQSASLMFQCAHHGLVLNIIHNNVPDDATKWDLTVYADIGRNLHSTFTFAGKPYTFNFSQQQWVCKDNEKETLPCNIATGFPEVV